jgi:hypothetical protein
VVAGDDVVDGVVLLHRTPRWSVRSLDHHGMAKTPRPGSDGCLRF